MAKIAEEREAKRALQTVLWSRNRPRWTPHSWMAWQVALRTRR